MTSQSDMRPANLWQQSVWGIGRGLSVDMALYPLTVLKIRQQALLEPTPHLASLTQHIWKQEGIAGLYRGALPQMGKVGVRQAWCWPVIVQLPEQKVLSSYHPLINQALTGVMIASMDATVSMPLEKAKVRIAAGGTAAWNARTWGREAWRGCGTYWSKQVIHWSVLLSSQQYLRDRYDHPLSLGQLMGVGIQVSFIVGIVTLPFDVASTHQLIQHRKIGLLLQGSKPSLWCRGWVPTFLALIIHNIASVCLIDHLQSSTSAPTSSSQ